MTGFNVEPQRIWDLARFIHATADTHYETSLHLNDTHNSDQSFSDENGDKTKGDRNWIEARDLFEQILRTTTSRLIHTGEELDQIAKNYDFADNEAEAEFNTYTETYSELYKPAPDVNWEVSSEIADTELESD